MGGSVSDVLLTRIQKHNAAISPRFLFHVWVHT